MISFASLILQIGAQPYRVRWVNTLQAIANSCLVLLCVLEMVFSAFTTATFDYHTDAAVESFVQQVDNLMVLLLFPTPIYLAFGLIFLKDDNDAAEGNTNSATSDEAEVGDGSPELLFVKDDDADAKQPPSSAEHATERKCPSCGEWQPASYGFCSDCGASM